MYEKEKSNQRAVLHVMSVSRYKAVQYDETGETVCRIDFSVVGENPTLRVGNSCTFVFVKGTKN
jgi:hypothetical protein